MTLGIIRKFGPISPKNLRGRKRPRQQGLMPRSYSLRSAQPPSSVRNKRKVLRVLTQELSLWAPDMFTIYQRTNYATEDPITSEKLKVLNNEKAKQQFAEMHWGETSDPGPDKFEVIRLHIAMIELLERFGFKQKYFQMARLKEQQRVHGSIMTWVSIFVLMEGLSRRYAAISKVLSEINKDVRPHLNLDHAQKLMVETNNHLKLADRFISGKRKGRESRLSYTVSSNWDRVLFGLARLITQLEKLKWLDDVPKKPGIPPKRWRSA